jgi:uncharacterized protein (TIGR02246 family)
MNPMLCALLLFTLANAPADIKAVLTTQVQAWNHGDIPTFVNTYANDCIFVGKDTAHGKTQLLARYKKAYPTPEKMGHLTFTNLDIHLLDENVAVVIANWRLDRTAAAGGSKGGLFSLVLHHEPTGWKIALDHTQ